MESKTALVGAQSGVKLNTIAAVDLKVAAVVFPDDAELDNALRDSSYLESGTILRVFLKQYRVLKCAGQFCSSNVSLAAHGEWNRPAIPL